MEHPDQVSLDSRDGGGGEIIPETRKRHHGLIK